MEKEIEKTDTKYKGVRKNKHHGRIYWRAEVMVNGEQIGLGTYHDPKKAAKAYDLYVIKYGLNRKTNFFKKKLA